MVPPATLLIVTPVVAPLGALVIAEIPVLAPPVLWPVLAGTSFKPGLAPFGASFNPDLPSSFQLGLGLAPPVLPLNQPVLLGFGRHR